MWKTKVQNHLGDWELAAQFFKFWPMHLIFIFAFWVNMSHWYSYFNLYIYSWPASNWYDNQMKYFLCGWKQLFQGLRWSFRLRSLLGAGGGEVGLQQRMNSENGYSSSENINSQNWWHVVHPWPLHCFPFYIKAIEGLQISSELRHWRKGDESFLSCNLCGLNCPLDNG